MVQKNKIKKIAILLSALEGGGAERVMVNLANFWVEKGIAVDFLIGRLEGPYVSLISNQVRVLVLKRRTSTLLPKVVKYLKQEQPEVLISTLQFVNVIAAIAGKISRIGTKVILREANSPGNKIKYAISWKRKLIYGPLARFAYPLADGFVSVSQGLKNEMVHFYGLPSSKIKAIYNPIVSAKLEVLAQAPASHPWFDQGHDVLLAAGRMHPQKDFETLLRAFAIVRRNRQCKLIIMGKLNKDSAYYIRIKKLIKTLDLTEEVDIIGFQKNPFAFFSKAKLLVLSSLFEGLPGVLIQALALGCPIVSTNCPHGPKEILDNGRYGLLVPIKNYAAMAEAILQTLDSPNNKAEKKSRSQLFGIGQAEEYLFFFESILQQKPSIETDQKQAKLL